MPPTVFDMLMGAAGLTADPEKAHLIFSANDCDFDTAPGFSASVSTGDQDTKAVYTVDGSPTSTATSTSIDGGGGLINVPPGAANVITTFEPTGAKIGELPVFFRKGAITSVVLGPTPL